MGVRDLYLVRSVQLPYKADAILIVDANALLAGAKPVPNPAYKPSIEPLFQVRCLTPRPPDRSHSASHPTANENAE
jgi:hypothetical protein